MRNSLTILVMTIMIASCNSNKKEETKTTDTKDTGITLAPDTTGRNTLKDIEVPINGLDMIGGLVLGLVDSKTIELLGQPDSKSKIEEWGADGMFHQDWVYKSKGITLNMSGEKNTGTQQIFSITVSAPSTLKTPKNIGIGSTYQEVRDAYSKDIDPTATDKTTITVGSVYGGIIFNFKNDKASKIFIGAAAE